MCFRRQCLRLGINFLMHQVGQAWTVFANEPGRATPPTAAERNLQSFPSPWLDWQVLFASCMAEYTKQGRRYNILVNSVHTGRCESVGFSSDCGWRRSTGILPRRETTKTHLSPNPMLNSASKQLSRIALQSCYSPFLVEASRNSTI